MAIFIIIQNSLELKNKPNRRSTEMKKTIIAAALLAALTLAGIQTVSAHGGGYLSSNNYGPGYCGTDYNDSSGNSGYGHGQGMIGGYDWGHRGNGWGHHGYMMGW
jgi:hypothetical protein